MNLDQWLKQVYDEETLTKEASNLEVMFDRMDPSELLEIAAGSSTVEKTAAAKMEKNAWDRDAVIKDKLKGIGRLGEKGMKSVRRRDAVIKDKLKGIGRLGEKNAWDRDAVIKDKLKGIGRLGEKGMKSVRRRDAVIKEKLRNIIPKSKTSSAKLQFLDKVARQVAREHIGVEGR